MQVSANFSLGIDQVVLLSIIFMVLSVALYRYKKLVFTKRNCVKVVLICLVLILFSSIFYIKLPKEGTEALYKYGLPHYFYSVWNGSYNIEHPSYFNPTYFFLNIAFYILLSFFLYTVLKKHPGGNRNKL